MSASDPQNSARDDWKRVEGCAMFALSIYWPLVLIDLIPRDAAWWISGPLAVAALAVVWLLRKQRGLQLKW